MGRGVPCRGHRRPPRLAQEIRLAVRERTGLSCSVGVGENKLQAKIGSGLAKPDGVAALTPENWHQTMDERPTDALWGIGPMTARKLRRLGIETVGHLAAADRGELARVFGPRIGPWLVQVARGEGSGRGLLRTLAGPVQGTRDDVQEDLEDPEAVRHEVRRLASEVAEDVAQEKRPAVRVVVKVRFRPFVTRSHGVAVSPPSTDPAVLRATALAALDHFVLDRPVRLLGVRADLAR